MKYSSLLASLALCLTVMISQCCVPKNQTPLIAGQDFLFCVTVNGNHRAAFTIKLDKMTSVNVVGMRITNAYYLFYIIHTVSTFITLPLLLPPRLSLIP